MKWNEEQTFHFVKLYMKNELLWQPEHPFYRSKLRRNRIITNIISEFEMKTGLRLHVHECLSKIKILRSTYSQEVNKIIMRYNTDNPYKTDLKWFNTMHRHLRELPGSKLKDVSLTNISNNDENVDIEVSKEEWLDHNPLDMGDNSISSDHEYLDVKHDIEDDEVNSLFTSRSESPQMLVKRRKMRQKSPIELENTVRNSDIVASTSKEDEFDIYGKYVASQLRTMDLQKALKLQFQIQGLISKTRLSQATLNVNKHFNMFDIEHEVYLGQVVQHGRSNFEKEEKLTIPHEVYNKQP